MAAPPLEVLLTRLAGGPQAEPEELPRLVGDWQALDRRAAEHRLQPLLHIRWAENPHVPAPVRRIWADAYRASALAALHQRAELLAIVARLADAGIPSLALKGAWLAWHAYASPAERPLRDLDLLVPPERAVEAQELFQAEGFVQDDPGALPLEEWALRFKHLPALTSPCGTLVELHSRLWDEDGRNPPQPVGLFGRAIADPDHPQLRYPSLPDMLMHLAVHAAFHRFDGGPLMLVDFDRFVQTTEIDWQAVWRRAEKEGWDRCLALSLRAAEQWIGPGLLAEIECPIEVPAGLIAGAPMLAAKPLIDRAGDIAAAKLSRADIGPREKLHRLLARRERHADLRGYLRWLGNEAATHLRGRLRSPGRAREIDKLDRWLAD